jgi:hypothetical protein
MFAASALRQRNICGLDLGVYRVALLQLQSFHRSGRNDSYQRPDISGKDDLGHDLVADNILDGSFKRVSDAMHRGVFDRITLSENEFGARHGQNTGQQAFDE